MSILYYLLHHRHLNSFPTRRSSDLHEYSNRGAGGFNLAERGVAAGRQKHTPTLSHRLLRASNWTDRKSTRLNSSHMSSSYAVCCLKKKIVIRTLTYASVILLGCFCA